MRTLLIWLGIGSAILLAIVGWVRLDEFRRIWRIQDKIVAVKKLGYATHSGELPKGPPRETNAFYAMASHMVKFSTYKPTSPMLQGISLSDFMEPADQHYLEMSVAKEAAVLKLVEDAFRTRPNFFVERNFDEGYMMLLPDLSALKTLTKTLCGAIVLDVRAGRMKQAAEKLSWIHRVERFLFSENLVISNYVGISMMKIEANCLLKLHEQGSPVDGLLNQSLAAWESYQTDYRGLVQGELLGLLGSTRAFDFPEAARPRYVWPLSLLFPQLSWADLERLAKPRSGDYVPRVTALQLAEEDILDSWIRLDKAWSGKPGIGALAEARKATDLLIRRVPSMVEITSTLSPETTEDEVRRLEMRKVFPQMVRTILDATRFKQKNGRWPVGTNEFPLKITAEWKGEKFSFEVDGEAFVVHGTPDSVGKNLFELRYPLASTRTAATRAEAIKQLLAPPVPAVPTAGAAVLAPSATAPVAAPPRGSGTPEVKVRR